ncbi:UNVERIFIED_CONTAM: hypothetical protein Cloal_2514 [Acetivibrio alkalicellulosi]
MEDNPLSQFAAILLAVLLLFVAPIYRMSWFKDQEIYKFINNESSKFVENVRLKGFVSKSSLEGFLNGLNKTGYLYDVQIIHTKKQYYPLYPGDAGYSPDNTFVVIDEKYFTKEILDKIYNENNDYRMNIGDNFEIIVVNRTKSQAMVFSSLMGGRGDTMIFARYGGAIQNEDY